MSISVSTAEQEAITLCALTDLIDAMVSPSLFHVVGDSPHANIAFHTAEHGQLFNILLQDFLAVPDKRLVGHDLAGPEALDSICQRLHFEIDGSASNMKVAVESLGDWLADEPTIEVWLPSIDFGGILTLSRHSQIRICGNLSKHYLLRQSHQARKMRTILRRAGCEVEEEDALRALKDFYERFHNDIFMYHASTIAELLNNVQWGIYEYLLPTYRQAMVRGDPGTGRYSYTRPAEFGSDFAFTLYWDLMNWVRGGRIVEKFTVTRHLKKEY
ncbi:hypothetical protein [Candidatus Palauibacter sp.]|uniref:hypothetical protein n=1 Tax=Candidatus Palauibacter sp. TaxID=3101350 RepID=UPI003B5CE1D2